MKVKTSLKAYASQDRHTHRVHGPPTGMLITLAVVHLCLNLCTSSVVDSHIHKKANNYAFSLNHSTTKGTGSQKETGFTYNQWKHCYFLYYSVSNRDPICYKYQLITLKIISVYITQPVMWAHKIHTKVWTLLRAYASHLVHEPTTGKLKTFGCCEFAYQFIYIEDSYIADRNSCLFSTNPRSIKLLLVSLVRKYTKYWTKKGKMNRKRKNRKYMRAKQVECLGDAIDQLLTLPNYTYKRVRREVP